MSRIQATVDSAIIALGALILLTLFALVSLLSGGGSDEVAAVLDSTELVGDIDPESPQEPSARSIDDVEVAERSAGAFPAPIGPTDETDDGIGTTSLPLDTAPDTDTTDSGAPDDGEASPADEPDDPPATTAPPEDEPSDDPDGGESGSNPNDDADPRTPEDPAGPNLDGSDPEDEDPDESKPDNENSGNEPTNTAPSVFLTWSGYTIGGLTGQTTSPVTFIASDPDGDPLTFTATGMPPGMTIDPATGTITGTFTGPCTCQVTILVTDGRGGSDSVGFGWTVT